MKSLSVILCTWNRAALLGRTLDGLRTLRMPEGVDVEFIVVDNNSTDDTGAVVARRIADWSPGRLRCIREVRQGKQFALNAGIEAATGEVLAFTDDDVSIRSDWLVEICRLFADDTLDLAGGKTGALWPEGAAPRWFNLSMLAVVAGVDLGEQVLCPPPADYAPAGTNLIARRTLFQRIGGFSETHVRHMDYEFGMRAARLGARIAYVPSLVVETDVPPTSVDRRYFRRWYFKLGIATSMRLEPSRRMLLALPLWVWREVAAGVLGYLVTRLHPDAARRFEKELNCWKLAGIVQATWHRRLWPAEHAGWVHRWSQKKGERFD